jgi:hypothetical protein
MQNLASPLDSDWLDILSRLPPDLDLNQLARDTLAIQRVRGIADAVDLLRLGLARGPGGKTLKQTAAWAYMSGIAELSAPSLSDRLHQSVARRWPRRKTRCLARTLPAFVRWQQSEPTRQQGN